MKRKMIFKNVLVAMAAVVAGTLTTACSDWDDHYEAESAVTGSATSTIWQNIAENNNLSQFAALLKKTGYDQVLNASQTYTVWAPLNGTFDYDALNAIENEKLLKEFVKNHIARSNFPASGSLSERIFMLNEKVLKFEGAGNYTMQGVGVAQANVPSVNGVIHTLNGKVEFLSNILESLEPGEFPIDSISNYIHSYDVRKLNVSKSIEGPIVDGRITYLDSVFDDDNLLTNTFWTYYDNEDSNYTMVVPTNEAWNKAMTTIAPYFNYVDSFSFYETPSTAAGVSRAVPVLVDAAKLRDSLMHTTLVHGLFYNNNLYDNGKLMSLEDGQRLQADSLVTTTYSVIYEEDAANLFEGTTHQKKSNGDFFVTDDTLRMHPWMFWNPVIKVEAEMASCQASTRNCTVGTYSITSGTQNPAVSGYVSSSSYIDLIGTSNRVNPEINFYLPDVLSTTYCFYAVFVPSNITNTYLDPADLKPSMITASVGYNNADGSLPRGNRPATLAEKISNDPTKIDTLFLGEFTFPICYRGTGDYYPYLRIIGSVPSSDTGEYDRSYRLDCILLVPKELDEYVKTHPGYKYQTDPMNTGRGGVVIVL